MTLFDQAWCDSLANEVGGASTVGTAGALSILFVVTDTEDGKVAFNLADDGDSLTITEGKLPRGVKADVTITVKEAVLRALWSGARTRDAAFMAGDIKVEGDYGRWLDVVVPAFESSPWAEAWAAVAA